jgi:hypothetical protein
MRIFGISTMHHYHLDVTGTQTLVDMLNHKEDLRRRDPNGGTYRILRRAVKVVFTNLNLGYANASMHSPTSHILFSTEPCPTSTGSATAIAEIYPEPAEAHRPAVTHTQPVWTDCVLKSKTPVTKEQVNEALKKASGPGPLAGIMGNETKLLVSTDAPTTREVALLMPRLKSLTEQRQDLCLCAEQSRG